MVITVYISGISGNKEVKKRQQRVQMIMESRNIEYEAIDIAEPGRQAERDRLKTCGATQPVLPPQIFNGDTYCGDYDQFDMANEIDELEKFLKLPLPNNNGISTNLNNDTTSSVERISTTETDAEQTATTTDQPDDVSKLEETTADGAGDGVTSTTNNVDHDANETADADGEPANVEE